MAVSQYIGDYYVGEDGKWIETTGNDKVYEIELSDGKKTVVVGQYDETASREVFTLLNEYRVEKGLNPLQPANMALQAAANIRGCELAKMFDHVRPNGEDCFSVYEASCAENIAGGTGMTAEGGNGCLERFRRDIIIICLARWPDQWELQRLSQQLVGMSITYYVQLFAL